MTLFLCPVTSISLQLNGVQKDKPWCIYFRSPKLLYRVTRLEPLNNASISTLVCIEGGGVPEVPIMIMSLGSYRIPKHLHTIHTPHASEELQGDLWGGSKTDGGKGLKMGGKLYKFLAIFRGSNLPLRTPRVYGPGLLPCAAGCHFGG